MLWPYDGEVPTFRYHIQTLHLPCDPYIDLWKHMYPDGWTELPAYSITKESVALQKLYKKYVDDTQHVFKSVSNLVLLFFQSVSNLFSWFSSLFPVCFATEYGAYKGCKPWPDEHEIEIQSCLFKGLFFDSCWGALIHYTTSDELHWITGFKLAELCFQSCEEELQHEILDIKFRFVT